MGKFTSRAKNLIENPKHLIERSGQEKLPTNSFISWYFELPQGPIQGSDKFLTLTYHLFSNENLKNDHKLITAEALCLLGTKLNLKSLARLTFREVESFLRDQNNEPSFDESEINIVKSLFYQIKTGLIDSVVMKDLIESQEFPSQNSDPLCSLVLRNKILKGYFGSIQRIFFPEFNLKLIYSDSDHIYIELHNSVVSEIDLDSLLQSAAMHRTLGKPFKIVAVS